MRLANKVAVITGAGSGMGRASAIMFSREGAKVVVADINDSGGEQTAADIKSAGGEAIFVHTDVSKASDVKNLIEKSKAKFNKINVLFNVAGLPQRTTRLEQVEESTWDRIYAVNLKSIFLTAKYAVPVMKESGGGVIINLASIGGVRPKKYACAYTSAKGAAVYLTKTLAVELAEDKIRVNCINPTITDTPMVSSFFPEGETEKYKNKSIETIPMGRMVKTEDVAYAATYLASDESMMITGSCINLDGGQII